MGNCFGFSEVIDCFGLYNKEPNKYEYCKSSGFGVATKCYRKTKKVTTKPSPIPDNNKKKTTPAPISKNVCKDKYGNEITNSKFESEMFEVEGLKQFKKFLIKYYPTFVDSEGGVGQLTAANSNDCMIIRLFYTGDPDKNYYAIGDLIYPDWKKSVGGYKNSDVKSKEEFDKWKKGDNSKNEEDNVNYTDTDWQELVTKGQVSKKGVIRKIDGVYVMLFKYNENNKRVNFDDLTSDNKLDTAKIVKNINDGLNTYAFWKPPVKNEDSETNIEYPLKSKKYKFVVKYDANKEPYLSSEYVSEVGIIASKTKIDESRFKKFLLEKIKEKKEYKTIFVEDIRTPVPTQDPNEEDGDIDLSSKPKTSSSSQKLEDDIFGLNLIENKDARKIKYEQLTPILQKELSGGSRSDYFAEWNEVGKGLGSSIKLRIPALEEINQQYHNKDITVSNEILVGEPAETNKYTKRYFYELLDLNGDSTVNTATIYQPTRSTTQQKVVVGKCDVNQCRTNLIDYLKMGLSQSYIPANEQEKYDYWRNICNCNSSGCFEAFKNKGKLVGKGFEDKGYSRDKLNIDQSSEKNAFIDDETGLNIFTKDVLPRYNKTFNRNLTWKEISGLIRGGSYKVPGGNTAQIDPDLRIPNFGLPGSWCDSNLNLSSVPTTQKESFDERIDNKLLESIKDKNKKESIIENVLKNLLKDK